MTYSSDIASSDEQLMNSNTKHTVQCLTQTGEHQPTPVPLSCAVRQICGTQLADSKTCIMLYHCLHTSLQRTSLLIMKAGWDTLNYVWTASSLPLAVILNRHRTA